MSKHGVGLARSTSHKDVQWDRDEWEVRLRDGTIYAVFRDRQRDGWFIDAILD